MLSKKIAIIVNPNAGNGSTGAEWPGLREFARTRLGHFKEYLTSGPGDAKLITQNVVGQGAELVVCVGGDGTFNEVVNGVMAHDASVRSGLLLGFVPDGTGCDFVRTVPISRNIYRAIDLISSGNVRCIDVGRLLYRDHRGRNACCYFHNITSFGLGGEVDDRVNRTTKAFGPFLSFIWATLISIFLYGKKRIWLKIDDGVEEAFFIWNVAVANGQYHGGGMRVAPDAAIDDGLFDITVLGNLSLPEVFLNLPRLYSGKIKEVKKVICFSGKRVEAFSNECVLLDVDGEQPGMLPAVLEIVPHALNIIAEK
ncbi:diacylglycerol/lipid kinase family protein [Thermodesulfobacteriota bacterium]